MYFFLFEKTVQKFYSLFSNNELTEPKVNWAQLILMCSQMCDVDVNDSGDLYSWGESNVGAQVKGLGCEWLY